jgi:hypothetical protein
MQALSAMSDAGASADPAASLALFAPIGRFFVGYLLITLAVTALAAGAIYRGVLRPQDHGFLGLGFGADEARLLGLGVTLVLLSFLVGLVLIIVISVVVVILGAAAGMAKGGVGASLLIAFAIYMAMAILAIWLGVRLSLAGPATVANRRLTIFSSWSLTRGHFWGLFGCYLLSWVLAVLVAFIMAVVALIVASLVTGTPFLATAGELIKPKPGEMLDLYSPVRIAYTVVSSLFGGLLTMVMTAPAAEAYRQIVGPGTSQAETFS